MKIELPKMYFWQGYLPKQMEYTWIPAAQNCRQTFTTAYLCVRPGRGQVSAASAPLFGERNPGVELLQLSPEAL